MKKLAIALAACAAISANAAPVFLQCKGSSIHFKGDYSFTVAVDVQARTLEYQGKPWALETVTETLCPDGEPHRRRHPPDRITGDFLKTDPDARKEPRTEVFASCKAAQRKF